MLIVLASLGLIWRHHPLDVATSMNRRVRTAPPSFATALPRHCHLLMPKEGRHSNAFLLLFVGANVDRPCLTEVNPASSSHLRGTVTIPVLYWCPYRYWHCRDGVHFQYRHLPSARTSIGIAAMEFISSMGTWQVPVPVLAWLFAAQTSELYCTVEKLR